MLVQKTANPHNAVDVAVFCMIIKCKKIHTILHSVDFSKMILRIYFTTWTNFLFANFPVKLRTFLSINCTVPAVFA